jgi:hypothetical protein
MGMRYIRHGARGVCYLAFIIVLSLCITWFVILFTQNKACGVFAFVSSCIGLFTWVVWPDDDK